LLNYFKSFFRDDIHSKFNSFCFIYSKIAKQRMCSPPHQEWGGEDGLE